MNFQCPLQGLFSTGFSFFFCLSVPASCAGKHLHPILVGCWQSAAFPLLSYLYCLQEVGVPCSILHTGLWCVCMCVCVCFSGDRNPHQMLAEGQHPSSHLKDGGSINNISTFHYSRKQCQASSWTSCALSPDSFFFFFHVCLIRKYGMWVSGRGRITGLVTQVKKRFTFLHPDPTTALWTAYLFNRKLNTSKVN